MMRKIGRTVRTTTDDWVSAALLQLEKGGVDSVMIEAIADSLGVTKGGFYYHFADRDALLMAVLDRWAEMFEEVIDAVTSGGEDPRTQLCQHLRMALEPQEESPPPARFCLAMTHWAVSDKRVDAVQRKLNQAGLSTISKLYRRLGLTQKRAGQQAWAFWTFVLGQGALMKANQNELSFRERYRLGIDLLVDSVLSETERSKKLKPLP